MAKTIKTKIDRWDGGITNDPRDPRESSANVVSNFDILTSPRKMTPYRSSEDGDSGASTSQKQNFCVALRTGTTYSLYALGKQSATNKAEVLYKDLSTGSPNDLDDNTWTNTSNYQSSTLTPNFNLFVYYKKRGRIFGAEGGTRIWSYDPSGSASWDDEGYTVSFTNIAQGIVHSKDDMLYVPYDNKIARNNDNSWSTVLTLPTHYVITSISEYGNYLAIACAHLNGISNSRVYLWDRDSSLTTLSESVDWGVGTIKVLEEVDGYLIGISQKGGTSTFVATAATVSFQDRAIFRYLNGNKAEKLFELVNGSTSVSLKLPIAKQKVDNRLYFMMSISKNGAQRDGVWSVGRSSPGSPFTLIHERTPNNDNALTSPLLYNFIAVQDFLFIAYGDQSTTFAVSKTDDTATYSASSIYESKRFNAGDSSAFKDLVDVTITHEYLPTAGQVIVKYRKDEETSWTTILTNTTDNSISKTAVNIESTGAALPKKYKEIEFRIESTGGAEITGLEFTEDITHKSNNG